MSIGSANSPRSSIASLKPTGSYVVDLGGAYQRGKPVRSLHQYRMLIRHVDDFGFHLAEEFFWHNPSKLPSPIEWVNKRKIRVKDTVNIIWWLSKTEWPKANAIERPGTLFRANEASSFAIPSRFYTPKDRPSGHDISEGFAKDNGGAIPPNLLQFPNSESNGCYLQLCKSFAVEPHPARFPVALPEFFIKFLTDEGDLVLDIFGGSGTTGEAAEGLGRRWRTIEIDPDFARHFRVSFRQRPERGERSQHSSTRSRRGSRRRSFLAREVCSTPSDSDRCSAIAGDRPARQPAHPPKSCFGQSRRATPTLRL